MRAFIILWFLPLLAWAAPSVNVWQPAADKVCHQINQAVSLYQKNDLKAARVTALMAYFKGYDAEIEPAVRVTLGGPHVFQVERQFRDFSAMMTSSPDKKQIQQVKTAAAALCQAVMADAKALHSEQVPRQVFKVA